jgi:LuxR family maltose regulon positive regulatory protein
VYEALSTRELEVLRALVAGQRPDLIAKSLFISTHTVRNHLKSIYRKLDVHSHVELLAKVRAS